MIAYKSPNVSWLIPICRITIFVFGRVQGSFRNNLRVSPGVAVWPLCKATYSLMLRIQPPAPARALEMVMLESRIPRKCGSRLWLGSSRGDDLG